MKHEYHKGAEALKNFEDTMKRLFRAPKAPKPEKLSKEKPTCRNSRSSSPWTAVLPT